MAKPSGMGLPARQALVRAWSLKRPDIVHIATEGPLGWSALAAAKKLRLPVATDFHTNFHAYSKHYGFSWLARPVAAYLRRFHNDADCTLVPTAVWNQWEVLAAPPVPPGRMGAAAAVHDRTDCARAVAATCRPAGAGGTARTERRRMGCDGAAATGRDV